MALESALCEPDLSERVSSLDRDFVSLRCRLDRYFQGLEKKNPAADIDAFKKRLQHLKNEQGHNTALKFRVESITRKFFSYERMWTRALKELEEGTHRRELFKLRRKSRSKVAEQATASAPRPAPKTDSADLDDIEIDDTDELPRIEKIVSKESSERRSIPSAKRDELPTKANDAAAKKIEQNTSEVAASKSSTTMPFARLGTPPSIVPKAPAAPTAATLRNSAAQPQLAKPSIEQKNSAKRSAEKAPASSPPGPQSKPSSLKTGQIARLDLPVERARKIYEAYLSARKRCNESIEGITIATVTKTLEQQLPPLMEKTGAKTFSFQVLIKNGHAMLKAVPK